jgi:hypothetical protein
MRNFTTKRVERIKADEVVDQLVINDKPVLDIFEEELKGSTFISEYNHIILFVEHVASGGAFGKKCKVLKGKRKGLMEFEFISKHLRLYAIQQSNKKLLIYGSKKGKADSSDTIAEFRRICYDYLDQLNK